MGQHLCVGIAESGGGSHTNPPSGAVGGVPYGHAPCDGRAEMGLGKHANFPTEAARTPCKERSN